MKDSIRMGLKDILGNKLLFCSAVVLILILNIVAIMTSESIRSDFYEREIVETKEITGFKVVPTSYNIQHKSDFSTKFSDILEKNAVTFRMSDSLTQENNTFVFLILGEGSIINKNILHNDGVTVYAYDYLDLQTIDLLGEEHSINYIDYSTHDKYNFADIGSDSILIVHEEDSIKETISTLPSSSAGIIFDLLFQTKIRVNDDQRIEQFLDFVNHDVEGIYIESPYLIDINNYVSSNAIFIQHFMIPLYLILFMMAAFSFSVVFTGILNKMTREFTIHIQHGAKFIDIFARLFTFWGSMVLSAIFLVGLFFILVGTQEPLLIYSVIFTNCLILLLSSIYIIISLKRTNLFINMRGDYK